MRPVRHSMVVVSPRHVALLAAFLLALTLAFDWHSHSPQERWMPPSSFTPTDTARKARRDRVCVREREKKEWERVCVRMCVRE